MRACAAAAAPYLATRYSHIPLLCAACWALRLRMEPEPQSDSRPVPPSPEEQPSEAAADKAAGAAAIAEAGAAAAAAAAKIGGRHIVVTGHLIPEFCQRYSLPCVHHLLQASAAGTGVAKRAAAFENPRGAVLFWHVASQSWVFGFGNKLQDLTEEELVDGYYRKYGLFPDNP
eukprot:COSAG05_NODE_2320_length_3240_cov_2.007641_1_plen_173_part_00